MKLEAPKTIQIKLKLPLPLKNQENSSQLHHFFLFSFDSCVTMSKYLASGKAPRTIEG